MNRTVLALGVLALGAGLLTVPAAQASPSPVGQAHRAARTCAAAPAGFAACHALVVVDASGKPVVSPNLTPSGYGPADIQSAYNLAGTSASGRTVAIVDAYHDPTALNDVNVYRAQFGLPLLNSATGPKFRQVSQTGSTTSFPRTDAGWATEISLDLDMVSAACPTCSILLVEASSASFANLGTAVNYAASQSGVVAISNSYGGSDTTATSAYNHAGIAITASTGDGGYGVESPASFPSVVAVGGTSLKKSATTRGWSETAWSGAGSGCSTKNTKPAWQTTATQCSGKANADVSAVADPNTGVAVYDSTPYHGASGWQVYGGTSASSPIIASVYALAGDLASNGSAGQLPWTHASSLNDVTSGSNGTCTPALWCTAGTGWDGPTGLGTPNGVGGF